MSSENPMIPQQKLEREAAAFDANRLKYGHLLGSVVPRDRSEAGMRERAARLAGLPSPSHSLTHRQATANENAKYIAEFRANALYAKAMTEPEYVAMRRIDDGLDLLTAAAS